MKVLLKILQIIFVLSVLIGGFLLGQQCSSYKLPKGKELVTTAFLDSIKSIKPEVIVKDSLIFKDSIVYRVHDGANTKIYKTEASIERSNSASRLVLQALLSRMEFSTKGMQAIFSSTNYFRCDSNYIEGRGTHTFISPNGNYRLRISNDRIEKGVMTNGVILWTEL